MTVHQEKALARLERLTRSEFYSERCEMKKWNVEECGSAIAVEVEYGLKDDEGTLASIYCRDWAHIFIGERGGAWFYNKRGTKKRFKWYSILQAVIAQR